MNKAHGNNDDDGTCVKIKKEKTGIPKGPLLGSLEWFSFSSFSNNAFFADSRFTSGNRSTVATAALH